MKSDKPRILIVDDEHASLEQLLVELKLEEPDWEFDTAANSSEAIKCVRRQMTAGQPFAVILTDLLQGNDERAGIDLIKSVQQIDPLAMTILYTAHEAVLAKYDTSRLDAFDVIVKAAPGPEDAVQRIVEKTRTALRYRNLAVRIGFLRRYFSPGFLEAIDKDPLLLALRPRNLTIAFWDIRGFSGLCLALLKDPDLIADFFRDYCELGAKTIFEHGGVLDKFIGDGVMALFGVFDQTQAGQTAAAAAAVRTAKVFWARFLNLVEKWQPKWEGKTIQNIEIALCCGIHTEQALVGNLGTDFLDQFTAVGPHVSFAQRLQSLAAREPGRAVLISEPTAACVRENVAISFYKVIDDVKNIPGIHEIFSVVLDEDAS